MDVNASCSNFPSSRSHSHMGASTLALGSPISISDYSFGHVRLYALSPALQFTASSRVSVIFPDHSACRTHSRMSCFSVHHHFHSRTNSFSIYRNWNAYRGLQSNLLQAVLHQAKTSAVVQRLLSGPNGSLGCP
jgi:hypothetical protein